MSNVEGMYSVYFKKTERSETINLQFSIFDLQFPDKTGLTLRTNRLVRLGFI
jgi:hypothetical protein